MTDDAVLDAIRDVIQEDVGNRGLRTDPAANLITACPGDFAAACRSLAGTPDAQVAVVTGFFIAHADPPCGETDGPVGAVFLARALVPLGVKITLVTDGFCLPPLKVGLEACGLEKSVSVFTLPPPLPGHDESPHDYGRKVLPFWPSLTHLIALERVGPSHTPASIRAQPGAGPAAIEQFLHEVSAEHYDRCHTMKGRDITANMGRAQLLFEAALRQAQRPTTIGIGDGGNEIGMGKIPWPIIRNNIPNGGLVACRVPVDHLIVCGVSNWGAFGLAAGVRVLRGASRDPELWDSARERELLRVMVEEGPLVDGVTGKPTVSVDGLSFERYADPLRRLPLIAGR